MPPEVVGNSGARLGEAPSGGLPVLVRRHGVEIPLQLDLDPGMEGMERRDPKRHDMTERTQSTKAAGACQKHKRCLRRSGRWCVRNDQCCVICVCVCHFPPVLLTTLTLCSRPPRFSLWPPKKPVDEEKCRLNLLPINPLENLFIPWRSTRGKRPRAGEKAAGWTPTSYWVGPPPTGNGVPSAFIKALCPVCDGRRAPVAIGGAGKGGGAAAGDELEERPCDADGRRHDPHHRADHEDIGAGWGCGNRRNVF